MVRASSRARRWRAISACSQVGWPRASSAAIASNCGARGPRPSFCPTTLAQAMRVGGCSSIAVCFPSFFSMAVASLFRWR